MEAGGSMSDKNLARRTAVEITFDGVDITKSIRQYFKSLTYTDSEEEEADDLQIRLQDSGGIWMEKWLNEAIEAAGLEIQAVIVRQNWRGDGADEPLDCGVFELDSVECSGPPSEINVKATSLPFNARVRQTKKSKAWESYFLQGIANEIASKNSMVCMFLSDKNPFYERVEQYQSSDIAFLQQLCHDAGCSLKATNKMLVLFDQADYENKAAVRTIRRGDGSYGSYHLRTSTADTQYQSCRVYYNDPTSGKCIQATAYCEDYDSTRKDNQRLEICHKVSTVGEAKALAEKHLRLHNKFEKIVQFTGPGDPLLLAGVTVELQGWGAWDGRYMIRTAKHTVNASGYITTIDARRVLEGY